MLEWRTFGAAEGFDAKYRSCARVRIKAGLPRNSHTPRIPYFIPYTTTIQTNETDEQQHDFQHVNDIIDLHNTAKQVACPF
jgi:hypothetical protein